MTDMGAAVGAEADSITDGVVQLRFADDENSLHALNAAELAQVLQGLVEFTDDMAKNGLFGDGMPPEVLVRPVKQGSFVLEAILTWAQANPEPALGIAMSAGGALVKAFDVALKRLRGSKVTDFEHLPNGNVKIKWADGDVSEVPVPVWTDLNAMKRKTRRALSKLMTPLSDQAERLEVREAKVDEESDSVLLSEPEAVATRGDYREAITEPEEVVEEAETFTVEATLQSIDFRPGEKWRVATARGTRLASIEDQEFLRGLDRGTPLHKNDLFEVTIREARTIANGRTTKDWTITSARRTKRGNDDGDAGASQSSQP
ncbi:hypothetical protein ABCS02_33335 [Microbacterium sp. X-17]|uniref:hypothetical protein n=1 Tax=Microbacterium sp. X-17 TaxID=3144404 RepID=UPI0031F57858